MLEQRFVAVALCVVSTVTCAPFGGGDAEKVDIFAVNRMVRNRKVRQSYVDCFLDKGPCSPEAQNIKPGMVPDAIKNDCEHCTELQRRVIEKMMCYLEFHQPDVMREIAAKFDPDGEFMRGYIDTVLKNGNRQPLNPHLHQQQPKPNPLHPQSNPLPPQSNPIPPQSNPSQPQPNPPRPQTNPLPPQSNPSQPQPNPSRSQPNPLQPHLNPSQSQPNPLQPQPIPLQPQQPQNQFQPQSNQQQPPQNQHQLQQNQHQPQQKTTDVRTSPLEVF